MGDTKKYIVHESGGAGAIYGFGFLGALVYFIQHATSIASGMLGVVKAIAWPGVVLYRVLDLLKL
jgi:hypothetical protein